LIEFIIKKYFKILWNLNPIQPPYTFPFATDVPHSTCEDWLTYSCFILANSVRGLNTNKILNPKTKSLIPKRSYGWRRNGEEQYNIEMGRKAKLDIEEEDLIDKSCAELKEEEIWRSGLQMQMREERCMCEYENWVSRE
jgi:hypothetical protein